MRQALRHRGLGYSALLGVIVAFLVFVLLARQERIDDLPDAQDGEQRRPLVEDGHGLREVLCHEKKDDSEKVRFTLPKSKNENTTAE